MLVRPGKTHRPHSPACKRGRLANIVVHAALCAEIVGAAGSTMARRTMMQSRGCGLASSPALRGHQQGARDRTHTSWFKNLQPKEEEHRLKEGRAGVWLERWRRRRKAALRHSRVPKLHFATHKAANQNPRATLMWVYILRCHPLAYA